jgi:hypothetical protein
MVFTSSCSLSSPLLSASPSSTNLTKDFAGSRARFERGQRRQTEIFTLTHRMDSRGINFNYKFYAMENVKLKRRKMPFTAETRVWDEAVEMGATEIDEIREADGRKTETKIKTNWLRSVSVRRDENGGDETRENVDEKLSIKRIAHVTQLKVSLNLRSEMCRQQSEFCIKLISVCPPPSPTVCWIYNRKNFPSLTRRE